MTNAPKEGLMKIMKFGGGCLKNSDHFTRAAEIIASEKDKTAVVTSAMHGATDMLVDAVHKAMTSEKNVPEFIQAFKNKHDTVAGQSLKHNHFKKALAQAIESKVEKLERLLYGISYTEEITKSVKARILSYGERLSALILSAVVKEKNMASVPMEADKIGIITDEAFENATALLSEVRKNLAQSVLPVIDTGVVPVITGYFGCTREGKITTFGRNGSDYSAAVIASAVDASCVEIWKDVAGFMSADPKIVKDAKNIGRLSYYEAAELSYFGAKILYPRTMEPLIAKNIPVHIKDIHDSGHPGTVIRNGGCERKNIVKSITYNNEISVLRIHGPGVGIKPGIIAEISRILSDAGINIYSVITSQTCINLLLDRADSCRSHDSLKPLTGSVIEKIHRKENIALIAVVGKGMLERQGIAAKVFSAVARENINVEMISSGASEVSYYFIVRKEDLANAVRAVHQEFF